MKNVKTKAETITFSSFCIFFHLGFTTGGNNPSRYTRTYHKPFKKNNSAVFQM